VGMSVIWAYGPHPVGSHPVGSHPVGGRSQEVPWNYTP